MTESEPGAWFTCSTGDRLLDPLIGNTVLDGPLCSNGAIMPCTRPELFLGRPRCNSAEEV